MAEYILAHDLGTSGNKASLMDRQGRLIHSVTASYKTHYLGDGLVEQDPRDWWDAVCRCTRAMLERVGSEEIGALSFSAQMNGCLLVDEGGTPLTRSMIWADKRSTKQLRELSEKIDPDRIYRITGHRLSETYGLGKYLWLREHRPEILRGKHYWLNAKDYLVYRLTGRILTDYTDAAGTNLFDLVNYEWSDEILDAARIDRAVLPEPVPSVTPVGGLTREASEATGLGKGTVVVMGAGDGVAATVGAGCLRPGEAYNYIGSSAWVSAATSEPIFDREQRIFTFPHIYKGLYSPCGATMSGGGVLAWMKREMADGEDSPMPFSRIDELIASAERGARGILFLPYILGERSPLWNYDAKGVFFGMTMESGRADLYRAVMEGISLNMGLIFDCFTEAADFPEVTLIGGGAKSAIQAQILADVFDRPLNIPEKLEEATSLGAAVIGALGSGMVKDTDSLSIARPLTRTVYPDPEGRDFYRSLSERFVRLYETVKPLF